MLVMRESIRGRLRLPWITATRRGSSTRRGRIARAVLNRWATAEMQHAALLLGYDTALGHGRVGIFRHLDAFGVGAELGRTVRYGKPAEREGAVEALIMELCLFS
jgi:hypothetical protein